MNNNGIDTESVLVQNGVNKELIRNKKKPNTEPALIKNGIDKEVRRGMGCAIEKTKEAHPMPRL